MARLSTDFNFCKKAGLAVRLFCVLTISIAVAEESAFPESWFEEAIAAREERSGQPPVPTYERELVAQIRQHILETEKKELLDYKSTIPATGIDYDMIAIQGGTFVMGSPLDEEHREIDEGPQREVTLSPFWMGKYEVTWDQFRPFSEQLPRRYSNMNGSPRSPEDATELMDWVSAPTQPYMQMDFGMGYEGFPAIYMTQHGANKFCQWLSAQTGHFYRLPTEAEWEYACRAGTTGPFHCPTDQIEDYAVIDPEQIRVGDGKVGSKKPNPWGLGDMHGNVIEWCLDAYSPGYADLPTTDPWRRATQRFGRVVRGGSWYDSAEYCRSAKRDCSNADWIIQDPQTPKSLWWQTDAQWLGFRIVRPVELPDEETMYEIWNSAGVYPKPGDKVFELR